MPYRYSESVAPRTGFSPRRRATQNISTSRARAAPPPSFLIPDRSPRNQNDSDSLTAEEPCPWQFDTRLRRDLDPRHINTDGLEQDRCLPGHRLFALRFQFYVMGLVFFLGAATAAGLASFMRLSEIDAFHTDLHYQCRLKRRAVVSVFQSRIFNMVINHAAAISTTPILNQEFMDSLASRSSFDVSINYRISTAPVLTRVDVPLYESIYNSTVYSLDSELVQNDSIIIPATFGYPTDRFSMIRGENRLSEAATREAVLQSYSKQQLSISSLFSPTESPLRALLIAVPVKRQASPESPFSNWVVFVSYFLDLFIPISIAHVGRGPEQLHVALQAQNGEIAFQTNNTSQMLSSDMVEDVVHGVGGTWRYFCTPSSDYRSEYLTYWPWLILGSLLALSILLAEMTRRCAVSWQRSKHVLNEYQSQDSLLTMFSQYSQAIVEAVPDALFVLDSDGRILATNAAGVKTMGYTFEQLESHPITLLFDIPSHILARQSDRCSVTSASTRAMFYLKEGVFDAIARRRNGTHFAARVSVSNNPDIATEQYNEISMQIPNVSDADQLSLDRLSRSFAQVIVFHDVTDQLEVLDNAASTKHKTEIAFETHSNLLRLISVACQKPILDISGALDSLNYASQGPHISRQATATSTREWFEDASSACGHIANLICDISLYSGMGFSAVDLNASTSDRGVCVKSIHDLLSDCLASVTPLLCDKDVAVLSHAHPRSTLIEGDLALLRHLMGRLFKVTAILAHHRSRYHVELICSHPDQSPSLRGLLSRSRIPTGSTRHIPAMPSGPNSDPIAESPQDDANTSFTEAMCPSNYWLVVHLRISAMDAARLNGDLSHALSIQHGGSMGSAFTCNLLLCWLSTEAAVKQLGGGLCCRPEPSGSGAWIIDMPLPLGSHSKFWLHSNVPC